MTTERCGTYAEYQAHKKRGERPCDECREAATAYMRTYRKSRGAAYKDRESKDNAARSRALWRLAQMHPGDFQRLFREERYPEATKRPARRTA